jgi:methylmalonyl-CoA mutase cobalamin-binding domain/chain
MSNESLELLVNALTDGDQAAALAQLETLRAQGVRSQRIIDEAIEPAMARLDTRCTVEQFNLLEIMLCGRAAMALMKALYPDEAARRPTKGRVIIGALEGDVHDLGKNIFKMVLLAAGYQVIDCGKDCPLEHLIDAAAQEPSLAIGISGLISTSIPQVMKVRDQMARRGLGGLALLAGGAVLKQSDADVLKVDYVAQTAFDGLHFLSRDLRAAR